MGNSLVVQWLGLGAFTAKGLGSIAKLGTKIPQAEQRGQKKKKIKIKKKKNGRRVCSHMYSHIHSLPEEVEGPSPQPGTTSHPVHPEMRVSAVRWATTPAPTSPGREEAANM